MTDKKNRIGHEKWTEMLQDASQGAKARYLATAKKLSNIAKSVNAARLFVAVWANIGFGPAEEISELTHGDISSKMELLAYHLYPLFGASRKTEITPWHTQECINALDELFRARSQYRVFSEVETGQAAAGANLVRSLRMYAEVVRGSAYPEQTAEEIISIQGPFEQWFVREAGIGPKRAQEILWAAMRAQEDAYNSSRDDVRECGKALEHLWKNAKNKSPKHRSKGDIKLLKTLKDVKTAFVFGCVARLNEITPDIIPVGLDDLGFLDTKPLREELAALRNLIGLTPENRKHMSEPVGVRQRPLFVLPDKRVLLVDVSNALDMLWERFEEIARTNQAFYDKRYQPRKARWLEDKVSESLLRIFPAQYVYKNLSYPDPDKEESSTAELDIAVHWQPFLILVEAKASQFRIQSQLGDIGRLLTDIRANVEDAFEQARRAVRYIDSIENPEFKEACTGRRLSFRKKNIRRIYLITVSQHHLAELANSLAEFQDFGLFKDQEYPLSVCVADLETISEFCDGPDVFLHYVEKRLEIQREPLHLISSELESFGAYLDTRLQAEKIFKKDGKSVNVVMLTGFQDKFDKWMDYKRGYRIDSPIIKLQIPIEIADILRELRNHPDDDGARWIAFALLGMSDSALGALAKMTREVREANVTPGMFRRITHQEGDIIVSLVASLDLPAHMLRERTTSRAIIEKYRRKAFKSIGIGIVIEDTSRPFDCAVWMEGPWEYDENIEKMIDSEPPFVPAPGQKLPSRNAPCICGSGKKFKKCCLPKIEAAREKGCQ